MQTRSSIRLRAGLAAVLAVAALAQDRDVIVLDETFSAFTTGPLMGVVGAQAEYHYVPDTAPKHGWAVSSFRSDPASHRAWRVIEQNGQRLMTQTSTNKWKEHHPLIVAGDPLWADYTVEARFMAETAEHQCGIAFRMHSDRRYYFFGVVGQRAVIRLMNEGAAFRVPNEEILADAPFAWGPGTWLNARMTVAGDTIRARINDVDLEAPAKSAIRGGIGLLADGPCRYSRVTVSMSADSKRALDAAIATRYEEESQLQAKNPRPVVWRRVKTDGFGVGRNLRFGDLNGDNRIDFLIGQVRHHGPKDSNSELSCLTAMTFDGEKLWQIGEPDPWKSHLTNDVAFQIHDIDGDGRAEVIYCMNFEIVIADGATGEAKLKAPTPKTPPNMQPPYNKFPQILGDSILFCDLRGAGHPGDFILKDRYRNIWAFDNRLNMMWRAQCNTGHYPFPFDIDNDGKDEVAAGYSLFDDDGKVLWTLDQSIQDHADGVAIVDFDLNGATAPRVFYAASDEGAFITDLRGNILKHHYYGHVQNPATADFRGDLPGLETVSVNFWGNQGIVRFYDAEGDQYHDFEPFQHGSMCLPTNWTGTPPEFVMLSPNSADGTLFDGWGRCVLRLPEDGHPEYCYAVLDVTGDCRDEIIVWDPYELWVYTQDDNPRSDRLYKPRRNPLWNYSNYQATVSLPDWSGN